MSLFSFATISRHAVAGRHARAVVTVSGLLVLALGYFVLSPSMERIRAFGTTITDTKADLAGKQQEDYALTELLAAYRRYEPRLAELERSIKPRSRELEFITALEQLAETNHVIQKIHIGDYEPLEAFPYYRMPLRLQLEGAFVDITGYLQGLERLVSYVNIASMTITRPVVGKDQPPKPLEATITADTFWQ